MAEGDVPKYPAIPSPQQSLASLQASVDRLKEVVELVTGQRGSNTYSIADGLSQVRRTSGKATARLLELNEFVVDSNGALVRRTEILEADLETANATITEVNEASVNRDSALATRATTLEAKLDTSNTSSLISQVITAAANATSAVASNLLTLSTTVGGHTASISQHTSSINGLSVQIVWKGTIDGVTGSFSFGGVQKADGTGPVFTATFNSNVIIYGDLLVTGTVTTPKLALGSVTTKASAAGIVGGFVSQTIAASATFIGGEIIILAGVATGPQEPYPVTGEFSMTTRVFNVIVDDVIVGFLKSNDGVVGFDTALSISGDTRYRFQFAGTNMTDKFFWAVSPGYHEIKLQSATGGFSMNGSILVFELAR